MKTLLLSLFALTATLHAALDAAQIESITGLKGTASADEGTFKVTSPRSDVKISVDGWQMPPFMGLTTWAAFKRGIKAEAMCAGDFVVLEDEISPVMSAALEAGLEVTALHNHFTADEPKVYFMHIGGEGTVAALAGGVRAALEAQKKVRAANAVPQRTFGHAFAPEKNAITAAPLDAALGVKGTVKDGMYKAVIGRTAKMPCGCEVGKEMGVNTWAAFAGTDDNACVCGDFCVLESELQPVLKSLTKAGIHVVAVHHHMTGEQPRYLFLHYWGKGSAEKLAASLKQTLALQK
jgi:hypothetical protein